MRKQVRIAHQTVHGYTEALYSESKDLAKGYAAKRLLKRVRS